jgi:D-alanine-D-alanine ligase
MTEKKPRKLRVGVVFGGRSGEHEVSLAGAASVMAAMDKRRFELVPIGIADGRWLMARPAARPGPGGRAARPGLGDPEAHTKHELLERASPRTPARRSCAWRRPSGCRPARDRLDVVLVLPTARRARTAPLQGAAARRRALHRRGRARLCDRHDKVAMKDLFRAHGLPIVEYAVVRRHDWERACCHRAASRARSASRASSNPPISARASASARSRRPRIWWRRWSWPPATTGAS